MERFTRKIADNIYDVDTSTYEKHTVLISTDCLSKLGEYEDLEEDGRLIKLPCKIGAKVYNKNWNWFGTVEEISINSDGIFLYVTSGGYNHLVKQDEIEFE